MPLKGRNMLDILISDGVVAWSVSVRRNAPWNRLTRHAANGSLISYRGNERRPAELAVFSIVCGTVNAISPGFIGASGDSNGP